MGYPYDDENPSMSRSRTGSSIGASFEQGQQSSRAGTDDSFTDDEEERNGQESSTYISKGSVNGKEGALFSASFDDEEGLTPFVLFSNLVVCAFYFVSGATATVLYCVMESAKGYIYPIILSSSTFDRVTMSFTTTAEVAFDVPISILIIAFFFVNFVCHLYLALRKQHFSKIVRDNLSYVKWFEFSTSTSLMVTVVAITFGVNDLGSILPMIGCQVAMSYFLCAFERMNRHRAFVSGGSPNVAVHWEGLMLGCLIGSFVWPPVGISGIVGLSNGGWNWGSYFPWMYAVLLLTLCYTFLTSVSLAAAYCCGNKRSYESLLKWDIVFGCALKIAFGWTVFSQSLLVAQ